MIPFQVYILWHENYEEGKELASYLFEKLNRNPGKVSLNEIGIPVYFRNLDKNEGEIQVENAKKTAIVILIDDNMVVNSEWENYLNNLIEMSEREEKIILYPVAINNRAYNFNANLSKVNFIRMYDLEMWEDIYKDTRGISQNTIFRKEFLLCELACEFTRELYGGNEKSVKLFLSHRKTDGLEVTRKLKMYIETFSKSKTFFDANDIEIGKEFWGRIEKNIEICFLIIIQTDNYTNSMWCRKEVLAAKKHNRPILNINVLEEEELRSFPYMSNIKTIRLTKDSKFERYYHVICEIYLEALKTKYNELNLSEFCVENELEAIKLTNYPELLSFHNGNINGEKLVVYPDPPLSEEEITLLDNSKEYFTPLTYLKNNKNVLQNKNIMISISEVSEKQKILKFYVLKNIMCELIKYILYCGGKVYYGGNLNYNEKGDFNLLKSIAEVYETYIDVTKDSQNIMVKNIVPYPITEGITNSDKADFKNIISFEESIPENCYTNLTKDRLDELMKANELCDFQLWTKSLTMMREKIIEEVNAVIIMGGKSIGYRGKYPGILEEFMIAKEKNKKIYLLGGLGGVSKEIANLIKGSSSKILTEEFQISKNKKKYEEYYKNCVNLKYFEICECIKRDGYSQLNNGLTDKENDILFTTEDSNKIIKLILKGMVDTKNN